MAPPLHRYEVLRRRDLTHDVFELTLKRPQGLQFEAGQYMSIVIPGAGPGGRNLRRAYSIASPPQTESLELCIKLVPGGPGTTYLNTMKEGSSFEAQAPFGDFVLEHDQSKPCLFIGTGTGLAPLRSMLLSPKWKPSGPTGLLLGVRAENDIIYPELFGSDRIASLRGEKHVCIALSRAASAWSGFRGRVTDYLYQMTDWDFKQGHVYLCGSGAMITEVSEFLLQKIGVEKTQIHKEKYF